MLARQPIVEFESHTVEGRLPPFVRRDDESQPAHQLRRVAEQQTTLAQRFAHELDVALLQVSDAAVDQLGAATRGRVREVALFEEQGTVAPRRAIDRASEASGA